MGKCENLVVEIRANYPIADPSRQIRYCGGFGIGYDTRCPGEWQSCPLTEAQKAKIIKFNAKHPLTPNKNY